MIDDAERARRAVLLSHALWDVRRKLFDDAQRQIDPENLDWLTREQFQETLEENRRVLRRFEELSLQAAYDSKDESVTCSTEEQAAVRQLASGILTGEMSSEDALDEIWSDGFPRDDDAVDVD